MVTADGALAQVGKEGKIMVVLIKMIIDDVLR